MTLEETKALIDMLRANGVMHYKTPEVELNLLPVAPIAQAPVETVEEDKPIPHVVKELTSLLKLSDKDLVDRLFPDTLDEGDGEESANDTN